MVLRGFGDVLGGGFVGRFGVVVLLGGLKGFERFVGRFCGFGRLVFVLGFVVVLCFLWGGFVYQKTSNH